MVESSLSARAATTESEHIRVSWSLRWRRFRQSVLPTLVFAGCVACTALLWMRHGASPMTVGEVEVMRVDIVTPTEGILLPVATGDWTLFDKVEKGQILARLDDRLVKAELEVNQRELVRLNDELLALGQEIALEDAERQFVYDREAVRLAWELQQQRLGLLDRITTIESDKVELRRLNMRLETLEPLAEKTAISKLEVMDARYLRDVVQARIEKNSSGLKEARAQFENASQRVAAFPPRVRAELDRFMAPIRSEIAVQESLVEQFRIQVEMLDVRAPFAGQIAAIYAWPGQSTTAGQPVVSLAAEQGRWVVSYVRDDQWFRPEAGMTVELRTRRERATVLKSNVERIGPQVELIAQHHLRNPTAPEWGLPVRIALPPGADVRPGELVDIRFQRSR